MAHHGGRSVSMTSCTAYNSKFLQMKYDGILQILPTPDITDNPKICKWKKEISQGRKDPNQAGFIAVGIRTVEY